MAAQTYVLGVGCTAYSRRSGRSVQSLAAEACRHAIRDANIGTGDIDAVIPIGGQLFTEDVIAAMRLDPEVVTDVLAAPGGNSAVTALRHAQTLLYAGRARHVIIVLARNGASEARIANRVRSLPGIRFRDYLERPYGWYTPAQWYATICRRHMSEHGTSKADLAAVAISARGHAQLNPAAMLYRRTLSLEEYYRAPMISDPYQKYDCCLETDGAVAVIAGVSRADDRAIEVAAVESARPDSPDDLTNRESWLTIGLSAAAPRAYDAAGVGPKDIDVALIYDCFTFEVIHQLEEAGFCERGKGGDFVSSGAINLGGSLPVNPHGGLLAEAHLGGLNHVAEAVAQLRNEAGRRQVPNARYAAVTGWGDWGDGSLAILRRR